MSDPHAELADAFAELGAYCARRKLPLRLLTNSRRNEPAEDPRVISIAVDTAAGEIEVYLEKPGARAELDRAARALLEELRGNEDDGA